MHKIRNSDLAMLRVDLGITQQQLGDILGLSRSFISMTETGDRIMPERGRQYLHQLMEISVKDPLPAGVSRRKRPGVAVLRKAYNRIPFSRKRGKGTNSHIATLNKYKSVLSEEEIRIVGEKLKEFMLKEGRKQPESIDACHLLMQAIEQKSAITRQQLEVIELQTAAAPARAQEIKANLTLISDRLKSYRQSYQEHPVLRKKLRRKIAGLYLKKLNTSAQLEKFNRPAIQLKKQLVSELKEQLDTQQKLAGQIAGRVKILTLGAE